MFTFATCRVCPCDVLSLSLRRVVSVLATCLSLRRVVSVFLLLHSEDGKQFAAVSLPGVIFLLQLSVHMELVEA